MGREWIWAIIMGSLKEINQDAQANGVLPSTLPDGDPSIARQSRRSAILVGFFVATQTGALRTSLCQERLLQASPPRLRRHWKRLIGPARGSACTSRTGSPAFPPSVIPHEWFLTGKCAVSAACPTPWEKAADAGGRHPENPYPEAGTVSPSL